MPQEPPSVSNNNSRFYTIPTVYNIKKHVSQQKALTDQYCNNGIDYEFGYAGCEDITRMENEKEFFPSAIKGENYFKKNRYTDVLALETSRIKLKRLRNDYINGNYVPGSHFNFREGMNWIVTQGPTDHTAPDFWYMITQENVRLIVMLCRTTEDGKTKCSHYWPREGETKSFAVDTLDGMEYITVANKSQKVERSEGILERTFVVRYKDKETTVTQLQLLSWPDHGVPEDCKAFRKLMEFARPFCIQQQSPTVIHCSSICIFQEVAVFFICTHNHNRAGIGRSSTFIASMIIKEKLRYYLENLEEFNGKHFDFEVFETVRQLRNFRSGSVQHKSQYEFIYQVMQEEADSLGYNCPSSESDDEDRNSKKNGMGSL